MVGVDQRRITVQQVQVVNRSTGIAQQQQVLQLEAVEDLAPMANADQTLELVLQTNAAHLQATAARAQVGAEAPSSSIH